MAGLTRGGVCGWCKVCLVEKGKHTYIRVGSQEFPEESLRGLTQVCNKFNGVNLSRSPIGQYKTNLSASRVNNDQRLYNIFQHYRDVEKMSFQDMYV